MASKLNIGPTGKSQQVYIPSTCISSFDIQNCNFVFCFTWVSNLVAHIEGGIYIVRVFENRVLRRIFGPEREEVTGEWRRIHKKELYGLRFSPNIIRVIKSRRMRWAGHVALVGERRGACRFWWGNLREGDHLEDPGLGRSIILKWIFKK